MKVVVCTMFSNSYQAIADITLPVLKNYCEKHGYELNVITCPDWDYNYVKHEWLKEKMKEDIDLFFYIDADALITNQSVPIESLIDEEHSFFVSEDVTEINGGVFILKNNDWGRFFNNTVLEEKDTFVNEQNVYVHYKDHPNFKPHIKLMPQTLFNAYDHSYGFSTKPPDLQRKALPYFLDKMANTFIWVVDDLNWDYVKSGTDLALNDLNDKIEVQKVWILRGYHLQNDPIYHNGIGIYLINKK